MSNQSLPLTEADLHLKQIRLEDLNDLGRAAMAAAFPGFAGARPSQASINTYLSEQREYTGFPNHTFDPAPYRRFAGDPSLLRGKYYTVAGDQGFGDSGTLVRELRSYYDPRTAGILQIFDMTEPRDRQALCGRSTSEASLAVAFLPLAGQPNSFAVRFSKQLAPMLVFLPLRLERRPVRNIVDLRVPETARVFAKALSDLQWDLEGAKIKCLPLAPPIDDFEQLLPSLLEQSLGGCGLSNAVGIWLRRMGAQGLIFPSSRVDASVRAIDGKVVTNSGWNFVDYSGSESTHLQAFIDVRNSWPTDIHQKPEGPNHQWTYPIASARIEFERTGRRAGSWQTRGLRQAREALWRVSMAWHCVDVLARTEGREHLKPVHGWLFGLFVRAFPRYDVSEVVAAPPDPTQATRDVELLGSSSTVLQEAVLGAPQQRARLSAFAAATRTSDRMLAEALERLLALSEKLTG